jgi:hypothetical protein
MQRAGGREGKWGDVIYIHICVYVRKQRMEGSLSWINTPRVVDRRATVFIYSRNDILLWRHPVAQKQAR